MANQNINPFTIPSQILSQSPSRTGLGALAKALGGLTAGLGQGFERKKELKQRDILSQLTQQLLGGQQQRQPTAVGQALIGQPQQPQGNLNQPVSTTIPPVSPPQPSQTGGIDPALIERITKLNPALGVQLATTLRGQQLRQQAVSQKQQFELQQKVSEMVEARLKEERQLVDKKTLEEFKTEQEFVKSLGRTRGTKIAEKEEKLVEAQSLIKVVKDNNTKIKSLLNEAFTGRTAGARAFLAAWSGGLIGSKNRGAVTKQIDTIIGETVIKLLKPTFGSQFTVSEGEYLKELKGKTTFTRQELERVLEMSERAANQTERSLSQEVMKLKKQAGIFGFTQQTTRPENFEGLGDIEQ